jgi:hypothetical protein
MVVWRVLDNGGMEVFDPLADTWQAAGWPIKFMVGSSLNFSDLDLADLPAMLDRMQAAAGRGARLDERRGSEKLA